MAERTLEEILVNLRRRVSLLERKRPGKAFLPNRLGRSGAQVTDWNNAKQSGFYWSEGALNQGTSTGIFAGIVTVHDVTNNVRQQGWRIYVDGSIPDLRTWERNFVSGVWHPWVLTNNGKDDTDSGWIVPTLANGFTAGSGVAYRKIGSIVYLKGELLNTTAPVASTDAFTLPSGYRPVTRHRVITWASSTDPAQIVFLTVNTSGVVQVANPTARTATPGYSIAASFLVN